MANWVAAASGFKHLAQLHVQTFDGVGGVNHLSDFVGVSEKRDHLVPDSAPALSDGRDPFAKGPLLKVLQSLGRQLGGLGVVDLFEFSGHWFSVFPITEGERITNQMDDAGLDLTVRINRANGFGEYENSHFLRRILRPKLDF